MFQLKSCVNERHTVGHQTDIARGTADIRTQQIRLIDGRPEMRAAYGARGRAGEHHSEGRLHGILSRDKVGGAIGKIKLAGKANITQPVLQTVGVGVVDNLHEDVHEGCGGARVFFGEGRDFAGH